VANRGSAIWGGATLGLVVGLILGFFVGNYWMTALYAVLIGAGCGLASNALAWVGGAVATDRVAPYRPGPAERVRARAPSTTSR
jgi:hypothetical protein